MCQKNEFPETHNNLRKLRYLRNVKTIFRIAKAVLVLVVKTRVPDDNLMALVKIISMTERRLNFNKAHKSHILSPNHE